MKKGYGTPDEIMWKFKYRLEAKYIIIFYDVRVCTIQWHILRTSIYGKTRWSLNVFIILCFEYINNMYIPFFPTKSSKSNEYTQFD